MSLSVELKITGSDLGEIQNRDFAEHLVKVVKTEIEAKTSIPGASAGVSSVAEWKRSVESRSFLGDEPFIQIPYPDREVAMQAYVHLPAPNEG